MLQLSDLHAAYGAAPVLHGISLGVAQGETVALLGPNGAGKSTLLAAITGTIRHRSGSILFDGEDLVRKDSHEIVERGVALVPEGRLVFAPFSIEDNLRLGAIRLKGDLRERYEYVYRLFPRLEERHAQRAGTLSGGEQQRFFLLVEDLDAAIAGHRSPHDIERCLQVIVQEARAHFDHENEQFSKLGFPHAERHIAAHARIDSQLWDALRTCYATEPCD